MKLSLIIGMAILGIAIPFSCTISKKTTTTIDMNQTGPPTIIYKTKMDYSRMVAITLNDDKTEVVAYPDPTDISKKAKSVYPTLLENGFLLDNRGVSKNAVFISMTYEEYANLTSAPSLKEMYAKILDKNPFTEMYFCGSRYNYKEIEKELNQFIKTKDFSHFKQILP